jgi:hypothetical protein
MGKWVVLAVLCVNGVSWAQEEVLTAGDLPLPASWKENALIVLSVNFLLGLTAYGVKKIPGKIGEIVAKVVDLLSANVKHDKPKS